MKLCSDKAAFEVRTQGKVFLNMERVRQFLEVSTNFEIIVYTPHMIILRSGRAETTLSKDGRMLIKRVANQAEATQVAKQILHTVMPTIKQ